MAAYATRPAPFYHMVKAEYARRDAGAKLVAS
jgi:hypothetical protein